MHASIAPANPSSNYPVLNVFFAIVPVCSLDFPNLLAGFISLYFSGQGVNAT
jgi:hypothetical protein